MIIVYNSSVVYVTHLNSRIIEVSYMELTHGNSHVIAMSYMELTHDNSRYFTSVEFLSSPPPPD
jgi:hypothetical protein